jgi:hypothetical protein
MANRLLSEELREQLPPLHSQANEKDPMVVCKFITPRNCWECYVIAGEQFEDETGEPDYRFYGLEVEGDNKVRLTQILLSELEEPTDYFVDKAEHDVDFKPCRLSEVRARLG